MFSLFKESTMNAMFSLSVSGTSGETTMWRVEGGLLFKGQRTALQHGDRIVYHSNGYEFHGTNMGYLEVKRGDTLLERREGDTKFPFDNRYEGGNPGHEPVNLLWLVLNAMANMANLGVHLCQSLYEGGLLVEEYELAEVGSIINGNGKVSRP